MRLGLWTLLIALCIVAAQKADAQSAHVQMGDWYYKQFDFQRAIEHYSRALRKDSSNTRVVQRIADSYRLTNNTEQAEQWYNRLIMDQAADPYNRVHYAEALRSNMKYAEAKAYYKSYLDQNPNDESVLERLEGLDLVKELAKDRSGYTIELLNINSPGSDFGPAFYKDGKIFFASNRDADVGVRRRDNWTRASFLQMFVGHQDVNGTFTTAERMEGRRPNGRYHEGPGVYSERFNELYFTRSNYKKKRPSTSSDRTVKLKLYKLSYLPDQQRWGDELVEPVSFNDKEFSNAHPALSSDAKVLVFASDRPGGYGGVDLYVSTREIGGTWSMPVNLGPKINTSGNDMFPFIADDGTLYFASDGHAGLGGLDVFSADRDGDARWKNPQNMGFPINSNRDDFSFIIDKDNKSGYFASNRDGGFGDDDIYRFTRKGVSLKVIVYDAKTDSVISDAEVNVYEGKDDKGLKKTNTKGEVVYPAKPNNTYKVTALKDGYLPGELDAEVKGTNTTVRVPLQSVGGYNLVVSVLDKRSREPIPQALVKLINLTTGSVETNSTANDGKTFFELQPNTNYRIEANKDIPGETDVKYLTVSTTTTTVGKKSPSTLFAQLELEKVRKGVAIKVENIYYDLDKWDIRPDAARELDKLVKILSDNPTLEIELSSHTDCRATIAYNAQLSTRRAESAVKYIISRGIAQRRMIAAGYGESRLVNKCACEGDMVVPCSDEEHQDNRRTEFKILKF